MCSTGKHPHIVSCMMELEAERGVKIGLDNCILFDDDIKNIEIAKKENVPAVWMKRIRDLTDDDRKEFAGDDAADDNQLVEKIFAAEMDKQYPGPASQAAAAGGEGKGQ